MYEDLSYIFKLKYRYVRAYKYNEVSLICIFLVFYLTGVLIFFLIQF